MMDLNISKARADFPLLTQRIRGKNLIYLDSAATSLKPWPVIERVGHFLTYQTANVHRGAHFLSDQATTAYESARATAARLLHASSSQEVIFTRGTTESVNLVAQSWGRKNLKSGDVILVTEMEHHSNLVPWQMIAEERGAHVKAIPVSGKGELLLEEAEKIFKSGSVKMLAVTHVSNTLGTINDIQLLSKLAHSHGALIFVDGAQAVANRKVDVQELDVDFYAFSGHKVFAPFGIGVLYGKKSVLDLMPPYQGGGSMISHVSLEKTTYHDVPFRFEAGTPNVEGALGLDAALQYLMKFDFQAIQDHENQLLNLAQNQMKEISGIQFIGEAKNRAGILSFLLKGSHPSDVGQILDQENIAVRAGHHCTQPLMQKFGIPGTVRASFSIYNSATDVDHLIKGILKAKELLS